MKRNFNERKDTSLRPTKEKEYQMPIPRFTFGFRFPSETNYGRPSQLVITHANFQAATARSNVVATNQFQANLPASSTRMPWNSQLNRQLPVGVMGEMIPRARYFSWRNPTTHRFLGTSQQFQEPFRGFNFACSQQMRNLPKPRFTNTINSVRQQRHYNMNRKWQVLSEGRQTSSTGFSFSIVSYNVLSDELLFENKYLYAECSEEILSWEYRKGNLLKELLGYNADILCLQEVDDSHYVDWFQPKLEEAGYSGVYNQRSGSKPDGCVTFYRNTKFSLVDKKLVKYYTKDVKILDRDNVGIVLLLQANIQEPDRTESMNSHDPTLLCVANTHLLFNKKRGDVKLAQLAYLFAEIDSLAMISGDRDLNMVHYPVILCGDFNSFPYSPLYHFITTGQLDYSSRCPAVISGQLLPSQITSGQSSQSMKAPLLPWALGITFDCQWRNPQSKTELTQNSKSDDAQDKHDGTSVITIPFQFESVYKHCFEDGVAEVTTCHSKSCCNVDYIFYTSGTRERTPHRTNKKYTQTSILTLVGKLDLLRKTDINIIKQLPNNQFSSDHIALHALFKLT